MTPRPNRAPAIKAALADPKALLEALGLLGAGKASTRQAAGFIILCPAHADRTPSCSVQARDGVVLWRCHGCQASGDALSLIAAARGLSMRGTGFREVLAEGARIAGLWGILDELEGRQTSALPVAAPPIPRQDVVSVPEATRDYPANAGAFWGILEPATSCRLVSDYLRSRAIDPEAVAVGDLARAIPSGVGLPRWAVCRFGDWYTAGYRLIVPMFDAAGELRSVRAWRVVDGDGPKRLPPSGHKASGLVMADAFGLAMLRGLRQPKRVVVVEGEPDLLSRATITNDPNQATIGIVSGSWTPALAAKFPRAALVAVRTDGDQAGDRYAEEITTGLRRKCFVRRIRKDADGQAA